MVNESNQSKVLIELEEKFGPKVYSSRSILFTHGKGALLYDSEGNEYIDLTSGHGVANIGYGNEKVAKAIYDQALKISVLHASFPHECRAKLYEKLASLTPSNLDSTFLSNSGTEANEAAIKLAIANHRDAQSPKIIAFKRGFHGRTLGALSLTHGQAYRKAFETRMGPVEFATYNDMNSVIESYNKDPANTIAVSIELIQGEGGVYVADKEFVKQLREFCTEKNLSLIFDEVQTGFGRTGKMFCLEHFGVSPDILCLAKGIAGGIPMGATISSAEYFQKFEKGEHASTFGGNPVACAAALAAISVIEESQLVENSMKLGKKFEEITKDWVSKYQAVKEIRGMGLMRGIHFRDKAGKYLQFAFEHKVLGLNAGINVFRMLPPLCISEEQLIKALSVIEEGIKQ